jgi:hypothetical protein
VKVRSTFTPPPLAPAGILDFDHYWRECIHMKTTLNLPDPIVLLAKRRALEEGSTLTELVVQGLKARLERRPRRGDLPLSQAGGGLRSGVAWESLEVADNGGEAYR